ncbi:MAG: gamma-glutamylcyclotransferase [bacterium]|nr:gamma-glutamylcyclotransferase [bacterium]
MGDRDPVVFFYGSFINLGVLKEYDIVPDAVDVGTLKGFDISVAPLATLVPNPERSVYGIIVRVPHEKLERLYGGNWVKAYAPEAVLVESSRGESVPALCWIAPIKQVEAAKGAYLDKIVKASRKHGFPSTYIDRLEEFRG